MAARTLIKRLITNDVFQSHSNDLRADPDPRGTRNSDHAHPLRVAARPDWIPDAGDDFASHLALHPQALGLARSQTSLAAKKVAEIDDAILKKERPLS